MLIEELGKKASLFLKDPAKFKIATLEKMMKLKRIGLAAAVAGALGLGMAGQASADVYAGSSLRIQDLSIIFANAAGAPQPASVTIDSFTFTLTNTAALNGDLTGKTATCTGTETSNNCGVAPTLNALAANANGSAITRTDNQVSGADNTFTWFKIGGGSWSNSDTVIYTSELTNGNPTSTDQIAESNITTGATSASASSLIQSITGFTLTFTTDGPNPTDMILSFLADPELRSEILNELGVGNAQANMAVTVTLTKDGTGGLKGMNWAPDGSTTNNCLTSATLTCTETNDEESLNITRGVTLNNNFAEYSYDPNAAGMSDFGIRLTGLEGGTWTLTLRAETSTQLSRTEVPEPASLALIGLGMLGLGALRRRKA